MITEGDTEPGGDEQDETDDKVKPIEAEPPKVERERRNRQHEGADQERARDPIDPLERKAKSHAQLSAI